MRMAIIIATTMAIRTAIRTAIYSNLSKKREHSIDIHGSISLFFKRLYFVFSAGKDERNKGEEKVPFELRSKTLMENVLAASTGIAFFLAIFGYTLTKIYILFQERGYVF